jgi:hypothetical protein
VTTHPIDSAAERGAFTPPALWLDAFEAQATLEMIERLLQLAAMMSRWVRWVRWVDRSGAVADQDYPREVVAQAVVETLAGWLAWSPADRSLESHILHAVRARVREDQQGGHVFRRDARRGGPCREPGQPWADALMASIRSDLATFRQRVESVAVMRRPSPCREALLARVAALATDPTLTVHIAVRQLARFTDDDLRRLADLLETAATSPGTI